jgi:hypothetical protein
MRVSKPGRIQSKVGSTTSVPVTGTGGNQTRGQTRSLTYEAVNPVGPSRLPLTVQRQGFIHPVKSQRYS